MPDTMLNALNKVSQLEDDTHLQACRGLINGRRQQSPGSSRSSSIKPGLYEPLDDAVYRPVQFSEKIISVRVDRSPDFYLPEDEAPTFYQDLRTPEEGADLLEIDDQDPDSIRVVSVVDIENV